MRDCEYILNLVKRIEKDSLREYFNKNIWRYERFEISKETCLGLLSSYFEGAIISERDYSLSQHILSVF